MASYIFLYNGGSMPETEAEQAAVLQEWTAWYTQLGEAVVDPGKPLMPTAKSIMSDGTVKDGPAGSMVTGYTVVKAASLDEAVGMAKSCPVLKGGSDISVYEGIDMM